MQVAGALGLLMDHHSDRAGRDEGFLRNRAHGDPVTLELWDALPNQGGHLMRSGVTTIDPGAWALVGWPEIRVNVIGLDQGDPALPLGTIVTFQAVIIDPNADSPKGVSLSNAVTALFL